MALEYVVVDLLTASRELQNPVAVIKEPALGFERKNFITVDGSSYIPGDLFVAIKLNKTATQRIRTHLTNGGFPTLLKDLEQERAKQQKRSEMEDEKLQTELALAKLTLRDYKRTRLIA